MQRIERDPERAIIPTVENPPLVQESACGKVFRDWGQASPAIGVAVCAGGTAYGIVIKKYPIAAFLDFILILFIIDFLRIRALKPAHEMEVNLLRNQAQMEENQRLIENQRQTILDLQNSLVTVKGELENYTKAQADVNLDRNAQLKKIEDLTKKFEGAQSEYNQLNSLYNKLEEESKKTASLIKDLQDQLEQEKKNALALKGENEKLSKNNANLKSRISDIDKENSEYANQVEKHDEANNDLRKQIASLTEKVEQVKKEKEELSRIIEKAKHLETTNNELQEKLTKMADLETKLSQEIIELRKLKKT